MPHAKTEENWIILDKLAPVILKSVEGCVVDIGVGLSTVVLAQHAHVYMRKQYSVDKNGKVLAWYIPSGGCHNKHVIYHGTSFDFMKEFQDTPALVFIDGKHAYRIARKEVDFFLPLVPFGGVVFLHDTYPPEKWVSSRGKRCGDVYRIRQELEKDPTVQCFTWPYTANGCGLTMIMKKDPDVPFCRA